MCNTSGVPVQISQGLRHLAAHSAIGSHEIGECSCTAW